MYFWNQNRFETKSHVQDDDVTNDLHLTGNSQQKFQLPTVS